MTLTTDRSPSLRDSNFRISARVLAILSACARYGVLTSDQIGRLDGGSRQKVTRILQRCVEHKLLRRADTAPDALLTSFFDARPRCYCITQRGLRALEAAGMPLHVTPKRSNVLLAHEVAVAEFLFSTCAAVAADGNLRLIDQPELVGAMPPATRAMHKPLRLQAKADPRDFPDLRHVLAEPTPIGVEPDRLFALAREDNTGWAFALELDRGTEDLSARRIKGRATWLRKVLGYTSAWRAGLHTAQWGEMCKALRVATVTTSDARIAHMIAIQEELAPAGLFLFATPGRIREHSALGPAWINGKGDGQRLVPDIGVIQ
jgi:hypothetical protein